MDANPDTCYFRYYTGAGQEHELKRVMLASDYANALAQNQGDPATPSAYWSGDGQNDNIAGYTSCYFSYGADGRVSGEADDGKTCAYQPSTTSSSYVVANKSQPTLANYNHWTLQTTNVLPDGSTSTDYTNCVGQVLLSHVHDVTSNTDTYTYNTYDASGHLVLSAEPSAVSTGTGTSDGSFTMTFNTGSGLVHVYGYGEGTQPQGHLTSEWVRQGMPAGGDATDGATELHSYTYQQSPNDSTVWAPLTTVDYTSWTSPSVNTFVTTTDTVLSWSGREIQDEVIALPVVGTDQHGSNVAAVSRNYYSAGKLIWQRDARGTFTYNCYYSWAGLLSYTIEDIDAAKAAALGVALPNPTARTNELNHALDETYAYDPLNRLSSMTRGGAALQSWGLDALDNMSSVTTTGSPTQTRTPTSANEIQNIGGGWITPAYDAAGNMISGPQPGNETTRVHYKYDAWNRLTAVYADDGSGHAGSLIAAYQYDGLNRRVKNTDANGWTHDYFYNQGGQMLEDRWTSAYEGIWSVDQYLWNPGYADSPMVCLHDGQDGYLGEPDGNVQDDYPTDWRRYYFTDANNNVTTTIRVNNYGSIPFDGVSRNTYTAYGAVTQQGRNWTGTSSEQEFGGPLYCGYFFDHDTGLYQVDHRYYQPGLSTWINRDPIGYAGGTNLYGYCGDSPTNATDPSGTDPNGMAWYDYLGADKNGLNAFLRRQSDAVWNWLGRGSTPIEEYEQQRLTSQLQSRSFLTAGELGIDLRPRADQAREAAERDRLLSTMSAAALEQIAAAREARTQHTRLFFSAMPYYSQFYSGYNTLTGQDFVGGEQLSGQERAHSAMFFLLGGITQEGASAANAVRTEGRAMMAAGRSTFARQALIASDMRTVRIEEKWLQAGRNAGLGKTDSIVYIVRDTASGELLKVGETAQWEGRFGEYATRAQAEGRAVEVSVFNIDSKVKLDRVAVERQMRLKLKSEGHTLSWDVTKIGRQYSTHP